MTTRNLPLVPLRAVPAVQAGVRPMPFGRQEWPQGHAHARHHAASSHRRGPARGGQRGGWLALAVLAALALALVWLGASAAAAAEPAHIAPLPLDEQTGSFAPESAPAPGRPAAPARRQPFTIKRILPITEPIRYGQWFWDERGVPAGPIVVTVDLDARVLSIFRGGYEIGTTAVLLGSQEKPTPLGIFPITQKQVTHFSNIYGGAPMPYMQRLTNDGVTIHATSVANGYASHGCVGVPLDFAKKLYATTHLGDRVYITRGKQVGLGDSLTG